MGAVEGNASDVNIFHAELHARSIRFFSWWSPPEPMVEHRAPRMDDDERAAA